MIQEKKYLLMGLTLLLIATIIISSLRVYQKHIKDSSYIFRELIEAGNIRDVSLTVYYMPPNMLTRAPVSNKNLIDNFHRYKITIDGNTLQEYIDLFKTLNNATLVPTGQEFHIDARIYYVFETKRYGEILTVSLWGHDVFNHGAKIIVNGVAVEEDFIFYEIILPFLPENLAEEFEAYIKLHGKQGI